MRGTSSSISSAVNNKRAPPSTPSSLKFVIIVSASFKERPLSQVATSQCVSGEEKPNEKDDPSEGDWRTSVSFFPTNQPLFPSQKKRTNLQRGRRGTRGRGSPLGLLCCSHLHIHRQVDAIWCLSFHFLRLVSWLGLLGLLLGYAFSVLFLVPTFSQTLLCIPTILLSRRKRVRRKKPSNTKKPRSNLARNLLFVCHFFRTTK